MAERKLQVLLKKIMANGDIDHIFFKSRAKDVMVDESGTQTLADIASKVNNSAEGATKVEDSSTNGNIKINGVEKNVYEHPTSGVTAGTYNSVTVDAQGHVTNASQVTDWTGSVSGNISNGTNTITQATTRANLTSGEKLSTSLGKIKKYFADLGSMAFTSSVGTSNLDSTLTTFYNAAITTDNVTDSTSITAAGWVADARAIASLQNQINTINSNITITNDTCTSLTSRLVRCENKCKISAYKGNGDSTSRSIQISAEGRTCMIQTSSHICIATRMGAIGILTDTNCNLSSTNGQKIQIFTMDVCCFKDGLLTIATNDTFLNSLNIDYHCEVL